MSRARRPVIFIIDPPPYPSPRRGRGALLLGWLRDSLIDSAGQEAAVHNQDLAVHEAGRLGGQEDRGSRQLLDLAEALERRAQQELLSPRGVQEGRVQGGPEDPGGD